MDGPPRFREGGGWQDLPLPISDLEEGIAEKLSHGEVNVSALFAERHNGQSHQPDTALRLRLKPGGGQQPQVLQVWPGMYVGHMAMPTKDLSFVLHVYPKIRNGGETPIFSIDTLDALHMVLIRSDAERRRRLQITDQRAFDSSESPIMLEMLARSLCEAVNQLVADGVEVETKRLKLVEAGGPLRARRL